MVDIIADAVLALVVVVMLAFLPPLPSALVVFSQVVQSRLWFQVCGFPVLAWRLPVALRYS